MAFGDRPDDAALRAAWREFCDRLRAAGDQVFKDHNPAVRSSAPTRSASSPRIWDRPSIWRWRRRIRAIRCCTLLHAAAQARRRRRRLHVPAGVDRRRVRLPDHRQYRHRPLPEFHRPGAAPGDAAGHRLAEPPRALRRHSGSQSLRASDRNRAGWNLRALSRRRAARAELAAHHAGHAQAVHPPGLRPLGRAARAPFDRARRDGRPAPDADARDDPHGDRLGRRFP